MSRCFLTNVWMICLWGRCNLSPNRCDHLLVTLSGISLSCTSHCYIQSCVLNSVITLLPIGERSIVMSVSVCLSVCVCLWSSLWNYMSNLHQIFCACWLLWQHSDTLCISCLGLARRNTCCRQPTLGTTSWSQGPLGRSWHVEYLWHHVCT